MLEEVEKKLEHRRSGQRKQMEYLVKWKHQPTSENSWVKNAISIQSKLSTNIGPH
jgi:hypothetical protein